MVDYLRSIAKKRWDINPDVPWLKPNELKADVFKDLPVSDGALSIWKIDERVDAERVSIALAAKRDYLSAVDYVVFDGSVLDTSQFTLQNIAGDTPDGAINDLHFDLQFLTSEKLAELAHIIAKGYKARILQKQVKARLLDGLDRGLLKSEAFNRNLLSKLGRD